MSIETEEISLDEIYHLIQVFSNHGCDLNRSSSNCNKERDVTWSIPGY